MFPLKRNCKYFLCGLFCWYTTSQAFLMLSELVPTTIHTLWHTHTDTHARSDHLAAIAQSGNTHVRISHSVCVCFSQKTHNRVYLCENACGGRFWLPSGSTVCVWSRTSVCCALVLYSWEKLSPPRVCVMYDNTNTPTHTWEGDWERADSYDLTLSFSACRWSEWGWSLGWSRDDFLLGGLLWAFGVCILGPAETDYNLPFAFTVYVPLKLSTDASQLSVWDCPPVTNRDEASTMNSVSKLLFLTNLGCFEHQRDSV